MVILYNQATIISGIYRPFSDIRADHPSSVVKRIVYALLHDAAIHKIHIDKALQKAIFKKQDPAFLAAFQEELQETLNFLADTPPTADQAFAWNVLLRNVIALLPFSLPSEGQVFKIPRLASGGVRLVEYRVQKIALSQSKLASALTCVGLVTENETPFLAFSGTTYPAAPGFVTSLLADFTPGKSVGEKLYDKNFEAIDAFIQANPGAQVVGQSLGGALALHAALRHGSQISGVHCYNPPGLSKSCWKRAASITCPVAIYTQPGDIVTKLGYWPTNGSNIHLYRLSNHSKCGIRGAIANHARAYSGCKELTVERLDPTVENKRFVRRLLSCVHFILSPILVWLPLMLFLGIRWLFCKKTVVNNTPQVV